MEKRLRKKLKGGKFKDVPVVRSKTMAAIRGKNNRTTELCFRMAIVRSGIKGWVTNFKDLPGKPDFFFRKKGIAVFIDGCFWHGCPKCGHYPKTRSSFWKAKILRNKERDKSNRRKLRRKGIKVVSVWEHSLKDPKQLNLKINMLKTLLKT
ncbi:MAG: very short patch repair endonuclease [Planctomycetes bacterium]|nr:very short patch repair endonuclease [Planctomycetota bacterium]MBL7145756.1 very short patch repair endonuclease [Phycisphaerae bacterium]